MYILFNSPSVHYWLFLTHWALGFIQKIQHIAFSYWTISVMLMDAAANNSATSSHLVLQMATRIQEKVHDAPGQASDLNMEVTWTCKWHRRGDHAGVNILKRTRAKRTPIWQQKHARKLDQRGISGQVNTITERVVNTTPSMPHYSLCSLHS